jgi:6-phosphogluconolactonase (cycloisomerase 2 family)
MLLGCGSATVITIPDTPDTGVKQSDDAGSMDMDSSPIQPGDAMTMDAAPSTKFFLMVTQTPGGDAPMNTWGGVARYEIADDFKPAMQVSGNGMDIDKSLVADPIGLAFRKRSAELFVGNREGNVGTGSVSRFTYDKMTTKFMPSGKITGNGLSRVHQVTFDPLEDELFAANRDGGVSRFKFDKNGIAIPNGVLDSNGPTRGVAVSPSGKRLYVSTSSYTIRQFDLTNNGSPLAVVQMPDLNANTHFMFVYGNELYIPAVTNGLFYRYKIDNNDDLVFEKSTMGDTPISIAISPSGKELFAAGHLQSDVVDRYKFVSNDWTIENPLQIVTNWSLGMILVFPYDSVPAQMPW